MIIKTYVINLESSNDRKKYMNEVLKDISVLDIEYIKAVDGRIMTPEEKNSVFDKKKFLERNSIEVKDGEIGCTLSHQKCYREIVRNKISYALILEDDIKICGDLNKIIPLVVEFIQTEEPTVILLSGWYWYTNSKKINIDYKLAKVYDAFLTHSYLINNAAAQLLIEEKPYIVADDWIYIKNKGVKIKALLPHIITQRWDGSLKSTVNEGNKEIKSIYWRLKNIRRLVFNRILKITGFFEEA